MSLFNCCSPNNDYTIVDYTIVDETEDFYVCRCNVCGEYFRKWK